MSDFLNFFKVNSDLSMGRLVVFICAVAATILTVLSFPLAYIGDLSIEYVGLVSALWTAAFGGKNWAKNVEVKNNSNAE